MARWTSVVLMLSLLALFVALVVGSDEPDGVTVTCGDYKMVVSFEKDKFPHLNASRLYLLESRPSCKGTANFTHLNVDTSLNDCGTTFTETGDTFIFSNKVQEDAEVIENMITREHDFEFSFNCSYPRKKFLSLHFSPEGRVKVPPKVGFGEITFTFDSYPSSSYETPYRDYPVEVTLNEVMYFGYGVQSSANLGIIAVTCKATKDGNFYSSTSFIIIQNGCPRDTTLVHNYDKNRSNQTFEMRAFRFFDNYDSFYIVCEMLACHQDSSNSRCSQGCVNGNRRKKRETTEEKISTSDPVILKRGPLKLIEKKSKDTGGLSKQEAAAVIGGATAAGGFAIVVVIVVAVLIVKYRVARLLLNRNKVGDLYTTQDEQMSRRNAYIQEDDMIEKEGDMIEKEDDMIEKMNGAI